VQLLYELDFREANAHAQEGLRGANRARSLDPDAERLEDKIHFRANGKGCVHFHIASVQPDVGNGSLDAHVVGLGSKLRAARTTKPRALPPLFPRGIIPGTVRDTVRGRRPAPLHRRARLLAGEDSRRHRRRCWSLAPSQVVWDRYPGPRAPPTISFSSSSWHCEIAGKL
jgi:hypothetical protein